jgi:putative membrane protein
MRRAEVRKPNEKELDAATRLALVRTSLAHERTLQAWIRTAAGLITFGFSIAKFFQYFINSEGLPMANAQGPRGLALVLIGLGTATIVAAVFQYRTALKILDEEYGFRQPSLAVKVAASEAVVGFALLLVVMLRL